MKFKNIAGVMSVMIFAGCSTAGDSLTDETGTATTTTTTTTTTITTTASDIGLELVAKEMDDSTLILVSSADGVMALNREGETVHFDPWWAQVTTESCSSRCSATGIVETTDGFLAGYANMDGEGSGVISYQAGTASLVADSVMEPGSKSDFAIDYTGQYWVTANAEMNGIDWVSRTNPGEVVHSLDAQSPDWGNATQVNALETFNYNGKHLMLVTNEGQTSGASGGAVSLWEVSAANSPNLLWRFPEAQDLSQPRGGTIRIVDGALTLFYGQVREGVGSIGVAELSDISSMPILRANIQPPASLREWVNPVSVEVSSDGVLFVVDQGTPFGVGADHDRGWVFQGELPNFEDSVELTLSNGTELVYYVGTPTDVRLWSSGVEGMVPLPPEPIYVSIIMHNEEPNPPLFPDYLADEDLFWSSRASIIEYVKLLNELDLPFNWQSDWNFLQAVIDFDGGTATTNGKNIVQWMREDMGVSVDPHAHETQYNYADVAYLMEVLGGVPSGVVGGLVVDPPDDSILEHFFGPIVGEQFPFYTWQPEILWGGGTKSHINEYDVMVSGIWSPQDKDNYLLHDAQGPIPHVGKYKAEWTGLNVLLEKSDQNQLRRGRMHTLTIGDGLIVFGLEPTFLSDQAQYFEAYLKRDNVVFVTLQEAIEIWEQQYNAEGHAISWQQHIDKGN